MDQLPTGTVTFLFTDIEGSTRLVQELGDRWADLLTRHDEILRSAIAKGDGTEVSTEGDAFFVAFDTANGAVTTAVQAQQALATQEWPEGAEVRVRMGLHTGGGTLGGSDYVGLDVHRAARIASTAYGGQVILSAATAHLVANSLPDGVELRDLGPHRLKDLSRSEHLFQLAIGGLPTDFPTLKTLDARPNNLPIQLTSFVGRDGEIEGVRNLLDAERFVSLTGPGGTGKTRLALQVAAEVIARFPDGVFFVALAPIVDPGLVVSTIASTLGIPEDVEHPLAETVKQWLASREILLILDNFEQVVDAAPLVTDLLAAAPNARIVVTSRAPLHMSGEHEFPVEPLRVPDPDHLPSLESLSQFEAVALFIERAQATHPDFEVTNDTAPAVAEISSRLDGLPLAIELAAARTRLLSPQAILGRLESRLDFLSSGARDLPARQQTLRSSIDWSYGLLTKNEQAFFRRLSVFVGGWTLEAADATCAPEELGLDTLDCLFSLADQSLVRHQETEQTEPRFMMLDTIGEYAAERLAEAAEAEDLQLRHAHHFLATAEAAEPKLTSSSEVVDNLGYDHDNFRAALAWALEASDAEVGLRLGHALWRFWQLRAHLEEGRDWFDRLLALPGADEPTRTRALGLTGAAGIAYWQNDYPAAESWYQEAEEIYRDLGDQQALSEAIYNTSYMARLGGDLEEARRLAAEGAALARKVGNQALLRQHVGVQGYTALMEDDFAAARPLVEEALAIAEADQSQFELANAYHMIGQIDRLEENYEDAAPSYRRAVEILRELGSAAPMIEPLQGLAAVAVASGDSIRCARLLGAVEALRERIGGGPPPEWIRLGDPLEEARQAIGSEQVDEALSEGRAMQDNEIVRYALGNS